MVPARRLAAGILLASGIAFTAPASAIEQDIVLVLDNSGSMRQSDPGFLARTAVENLIGGYGPDTSLAILIFDTTPRMLTPLTQVTDESSRAMLDGLRALDYSGQRTNIPSAIERAVYHLRVNGRDGVPHTVLFMTDGQVDTGDPGRDRDMERWMLDELTVMASDSGIRIFGIAFTDDADFAVIQTLAQRTGAEYLRAFTADEIEPAFTRMHALIEDAHVQQARTAPPQAEPQPTRPVEPVTAVIDPEPQATPEPETLAESDADGSGPALHAPAWLPYALGAVALLLAAGGVYFWRARRGGRTSAAGGMAAAPKAMMYDLNGVTTLPRHEIRAGQVTIGRVSVPDAPRASYILIDRTTISRKHATISLRDGHYLIEDHGTTNGTFVNDRRIAAPQRLRDGDKVRFDTFEFAFRDFAVPADADVEEADDRTQISGVPAAPPMPQRAAGPAPRPVPKPVPKMTPAPAARERSYQEVDLLLGDDEPESLEPDEGGDDRTVLFSNDDMARKLDEERARKRNTSK